MPQVRDRRHQARPLMAYVSYCHMQLTLSHGAIWFYLTSIRHFSTCRTLESLPYSRPTRARLSYVASRNISQLLVASACPDQVSHSGTCRPSCYGPPSGYWSAWSSNLPPTGPPVVFYDQVCLPTVTPVARLLYIQVPPDPPPRPFCSSPNSIQDPTVWHRDKQQVLPDPQRLVPSSSS